MDINSQKPTNRAGKVSNSPKLKGLSAEEKLERSLKNLSHTSSTSTNTRLNNYASNSYKKTKSTSTRGTSRKKVGGVVLDVETIQDANKQKFETKTKRNNVVILILSLLLVASLIYLALAILNYRNSKREPNCQYLVHGDAEAEWIVEGKNDTKFTLRQGLATNMVYLLNSSINIKTTQTVMLSIEINVLIEDEPYMIWGLYEGNSNLIRVENSNEFVYETTIAGGGTIALFKGIDFSEAPDSLSSENVKIEIIANINIV